MKADHRVFFLIAATAGLIPALAALLQFHEASFMGWAVLGTACAAIVGFIRPPRVFFCGLIFALTIPVVTTAHRVIGSLKGAFALRLLPLDFAFSFVLGVALAFVGIGLGLGIRALAGKAKPVTMEWTGSQHIRKTILTGFLLLIAASLYVSISIEPEPPLETGITRGTDLLSKSVFATQPQLGEVTSIRMLPNETPSDVTLLVAGTQGAATISRNGNVKSLITFDTRKGKVEPLSTKSAMEFEFVDTGGGWQPVSLISSAGKTLWQTPADAAPDEMAPVDLDGDGLAEFVIGYNGRGGLKAFDRSGAELWSHPASNVFSVKTATMNGADVIIHTDGDEIIIRSLVGDKLRTLPLPVYSFVVDSWGERPAIITQQETWLRVYDLEGSSVDSLPIMAEGTDLCTTRIMFLDEGPVYRAVVVSLLASTGLSELYLFDERDTLAYHEVFSGKYPAMAVTRTPEDGRNALLVGGSEGTVTEYRWNGED
jgi:hypothetical protein